MSAAFTIERVATKTTYTGPASSEYYQPFTASASLVDPSGGAGVAGKTVTFTLGTGNSCSGVTDGSGNASCSITPTQSAGDYSVVASFAGDAGYLPSSDTKPFTITRAHTTTTLTAAPAGSSKFGQPVTFTAVSAAVSLGAPAPTGSTAFSVDGTTVASNVLTGGSATTGTASLAAGSHAIGAAYSGDANFLPSTGSLAYTVTCDVNVSGVHQGALIVTGSTCVAAGGKVNGAIIVEAGGALDLEGASIGGAVGATEGAGAIRVCGTSIAGPVDVKNAAGLVMVGDPAGGCAANTIGGALDVKNNTHGVEAIDNTVGGAITTEANSGAGPFPGDPTTISGNHPPATPDTPLPTTEPAAAQTTQPAQPSGSAPASTTSTSSPAGTGASAIASRPAGTSSGSPTALGASSPSPAAKPLTKAQKLAAALTACNKLSKAKKRSCNATAKKRYLPTPKKKPK